MIQPLNILASGVVQAEDLTILQGRLVSGAVYRFHDLYDEYIQITKDAGRRPASKVGFGRALAKLPGWVAGKAYVGGVQMRVWTTP